MTKFNGTSLAMKLVSAFLLPLLVQTNRAMADVGPLFGDVGWITSAVVSEINTNGRFELDERIEIQYRLWGVQPKQGYVTFLKENILGDELICIHAGHTSHTGRRPSPLKPLPNTVVCQRPGEHSPFPGGIAGELFEAGVAEPYCLEAVKYLPSCAESIQ
ncbi:hypothetical protein [Aliiroseovarius pelagivivens]|uniref:hypothetical protein n=1 Tax=Aliiroseovarius pelagivivens TaxID=1639690 RepID=UPI0011B287A5|nr:hypothetical protein [Aliiroseovarius pelagivivens]